MMKFFRKRSSQCCAGVFSATMLLGGGISAYFSIMIFNKCLDTVAHIDEIIGDTVTIPSISFATNIHGYDVPLTLKDVIVELPENFQNLLHHTDKLPDYCYYVSLTTLMIFTLSIALSLGVYASSSCQRSADDKCEEPESMQTPLLEHDIV